METTATKQQPAAETVGVPAFQPPKKRRTWLRVLIILAIAAALIGWFIIRPMMSAGQQMLRAAYLSGPAQVRDMTVSVSSTGTVKPVDSCQVTAKAVGEVLEAPFEEGDYVEQGAVLYRLDDTDAQTALRRAQIALEQAQLSYNNLKTNLKDASLTANAAGIVSKLYVDQGDTVAAGSPVADILDRSTMKLKAAFHSADTARFSLGDAATVTVDGSMEVLSGTVTELSSLEEVGAGGALVRQVTIEVANPGALTAAHTGTAAVDGAACVAPASFTYAAQKTVYAKTSGELANLAVREGDSVFDGQVLGSFSSDSITTQVENARLSVENAELSLQSAADALDNYVVRAPITGTVIKKNFEAGDNVDSSSLTAAGGSLAVVYDLSALTFEMRISELDINKIQVGQSVSITADAVEGQTFSGTVDSIRLEGVTVSGMTNYPITVAIHDPGALKPGMNISAEVIVERVGEVLSVPVEAVKRGAEQPYVLVVPADALDENGSIKDISRLERREVTLGRNDDSYIEITGGLTAGETVAWENEISNPFAMMMGGMS